MVYRAVAPAFMNAEPAPRSIDLHDRLSHFMLTESTIVIASSPGQVRFENGQSTSVSKFATCPYGHLAFTQITPVTIDQPCQARHTIASKSRDGAVANHARIKPYATFQRQAGRHNRKRAG
jgi:hypothetical protein